MCIELQLLPYLLQQKYVLHEYLYFKPSTVHCLHVQVPSSSSSIQANEGK